jgi:hypothetical protein
MVGLGYFILGFLFVFFGGLLWIFNYEIFDLYFDDDDDDEWYF